MCKNCKKTMGEGQKQDKIVKWRSTVRNQVKSFVTRGFLREVGQIFFGLLLISLKNNFAQKPGPLYSPTSWILEFIVFYTETISQITRNFSFVVNSKFLETLIVIWGQVVTAANIDNTFFSCSARHSFLSWSPPSANIGKHQRKLCS